MSDREAMNSVVMDYVEMMSRPCRCSRPVRYGWGTGTNVVVWSDYCNNCGGRLS